MHGISEYSVRSMQKDLQEATKVRVGKACQIPSQKERHYEGLLKHSSAIFVQNFLFYQWKESLKRRYSHLADWLKEQKGCG